jgi:hypothetical protein
MLASMIGSQQLLPADIIQSLFYVTDPFVFEQKFRRYNGLDAKSRAAHDFVALERWVNDGIPMTSALAHDCLVGWAQENRLAKNQWAIGGKKIDPKKIKMPVFIAMPQSDHVVPLDCAMKLAKAEQLAEEQGWTVEWDYDQDEYQLGDAEDKVPDEVLVAVLKDADGHLLESLGGIGDPSPSYQRLVDAELALEAMPSALLPAKTY